METFPIYLTLPRLKMSQADIFKNKLSEWQHGFLSRFQKSLPKLFPDHLFEVAFEVRFHRLNDSFQS